MHAKDAPRSIEAEVKKAHGREIGQATVDAHEIRWSTDSLCLSPSLAVSNGPAYRHVAVSEYPPMSSPLTR